MIINKLKLENFGLFSGKHEIDLSPKDGKNIVIIGGKNGNGKTTLFEAIRLCLYGQGAVNHRFNKVFYEKYLTERIHHNPRLSEQPDYAGVALEFQHANLGKVDTYQVSRYWKNNGAGFQESFVVKRNDKEVDEVGSEQWQEFINDIIPPGLSQLFFFDGEKIQVLAEDTHDNKQLAYSFKSLLGVDLVEKLKSDLEIYSIKQLKKEGAKDLKKEIEDLQKKDCKFEELLDLKCQEKAQMQSRIDKVHADIERQEQLIAKEGGIFARNRENFKEKCSMLDVEIGLIETQLRDFCAGLLPFAFAAKLSKKLKNTLLKEERLRNDKITQDNIKSKFVKVRKELSKQSFWKDTPLKAKDVPRVTSKIMSAMNSAISRESSSFAPVHNLSANDHNRLISFIEKVDSEVPSKLKSLSQKFEKLITERHDVERQLELAPEDNVLGREIKVVSELHHKLGGFQQQIKAADEEIRSITFNHEKVKRDLRRFWEEFQNKKDLSDRLKLTKKVQVALQEYHKQLESKKIKEFSDLFIESYNQIARKKKLFERIEIDIRDYTVSLYKRGNKKVLKSQLSAGEKQIYAIAVLWALTKVSGRPLPFIIDTPLGRLDSDHRNKLVHNFFPKSSHQLIILSTDTEIDRDYLSDLTPYIARTYNLDYKDGETKITRGYFWG